MTRLISTTEKTVTGELAGETYSLLDMFRAGADTSVLRTALKACGYDFTEAQIYNELHRQREAERAAKLRREKRRAYQRDWQQRYRDELRSVRAER